MTQVSEGFWTRRLAGVKAEAEAEQLAAADEAARLEAARDAELAEKSDAELLEEFGLPDPDGMNPGDDFSAFMAKAVPERLRRRALRRLWTTNPVLANLDGLTDYSDDFTDAATVMPDMRTAYEVGRGMFEHVRKLAVEAEDAATAETEAPPQEEPVETALADERRAEPAPSLRAAPEMDVPVEDIAETEPEEAPAPRRHMRFSFATEDDRG